MSLQTARSFFGERQSLTIFIAAIAMGLSAMIYLYLQDSYSLIYYGDSSYHLFSAKRFVDSVEPGIWQIGGVWLPLPHWMFLPFTLIEQLYSNGMAGTIVSLPCHALSSVLIYKIIRKQVDLKYVALLGGFLYASNPNLIYLGITAMTEAPFLLFFIAFVYYFQKWNDKFNESQNDLKNLALASFFIVLATLCKYEAWILSLAFVPYVIIFVIFKRRNITKFTLMAILISLISLSGILFWLGWNEYRHGDPLAFANLEFYSAASQAGERPYRDFLYLQPLNVINIYGNAVWMISGPILLSLAAIGFVYNLKDRGWSLRTKIYGFLVLPPFFTLASLYLGIGEMNEWWYNARFATFLFPLLVILSSFAITKFMSIFRKRRIITAVIVVSVFTFQLLTLTTFWDFNEDAMFVYDPLSFAQNTDSGKIGVITYIDAQFQWVYKQIPYGIQAAEFFKSEYDEGQVMLMTGSAQAQRIMQVSEIPLIKFDAMMEAALYQDPNKNRPSFTEPWLTHKWLIIGLEPDPDSLDFVNYWKQRIDQLEQHYSLLYENKYYKIFVLR